MTLPERADGASACDLSCAGGIGSLMTVTASFALIAVSYVLGKLALQASSAP